MKTIDNKWVDLSNGVAWAIIFSLAAIIMSICALAHKCPRVYEKGNLGFDYLGVIVGILALLVTFLVAWQIWQTMASREEIRKAERASQKVDKLQDEIKLLKDVPDGYLFYALAIIKYENKKYFDAFDLYHSAVRYYIKNKVDYAKFTTVALDSMFDCIEYANEEELDIFKRCSARVDDMIRAIEHDIENVNRLADEARKKVARIKENARKHKIIS